jgi:hypothetical protein
MGVGGCIQNSNLYLRSVLQERIQWLSRENTLKNIHDRTVSKGPEDTVHMTAKLLVVC